MDRIDEFNMLQGFKFLEAYEQIAVSDDVIKGEKNETIQSECRIPNSLTNALLAIKC